MTNIYRSLFTENGNLVKYKKKQNKLLHFCLPIISFYIYMQRGSICTEVVTLYHHVSTVAQNIKMLYFKDVR